MIRTKLFLACALALAVSLVGTSASAQAPTNQITYFTFSAPFELPGGKTLPAGKYVFKILDSPSNRHVVQIMGEDQQTMHATLLAIPAQRLEPADEPEVRFMEAAADAPPAIRTWWYPGRSIGHEFIYPKDHARRLAARQSEPVLTVAGDAVDEEAMRTAELARIGRDGQEAAVTSETTAASQAAQPSAAQTGAQSSQASTAPSTPATPAPATSAQSTPSTTGQAAATPGSTSAQTSTSAQSAASAQTTAAETRAAETRAAQTAANTADAARTELPRTASLLPLIGLIGLGSLLGAGALRFRR